MKYKGLSIGYKHSCAYVYIWFSKSNRILYVGQTNDKNGVIGRAVSHVTNNGTLRDRCLEYGISMDEIDDFILLSYELPNERKYISTESSYRLAVEYTVQINMHRIRGNSNPPFRVISRVTYTEPASNTEIIKIASEIVSDFKRIYDYI